MTTPTNQRELAYAIELQMLGAAKKRQDKLKRDHDPAWRVVCLFGCGWFNGDSPLAGPGEVCLINLALELGVVLIGWKPAT